MAAGDLTTLDNVKAWLGLDDTQVTDDVLLTRLITAASGFIRTWCSRDFVSQPYTEIRDGIGGRKMALANFPITAVSALTIDGQAIPAGAVPATPGYIFTDIMLVLIGYGFNRGMANVMVSYTAGFATVPLEIEQACIELIAFRYREAQRVGMSSKGMLGETTSFIVRDVPPSVATVLNQYKKVIPA